MFPEDALGDRDALLFYKPNDFFVKLLCQLRLACSVEAGTATFAAIAVKCEIADKQNRPADVLHAEIHLAGIVGKYSQVNKFVGHELYIGLGVTFTDAEINQKPPADLTDYSVVDFYLCF